VVGDGPVERLLADVALGVQRPRPFEIAASPHYLGARLRDPGRGGVDRRLEGLPLEDEQQRALPDVVAFPESAPHQESLNASAQIHGIDRHGLTHVLHLRIDLASLHGSDHDRRRRLRRVRARLLVTAGSKRQHGRHQQSRANAARKGCDANQYLRDRVITSGKCKRHHFRTAPSRRRTSSAGACPACMTSDGNHQQITPGAPACACGGCAAKYACTSAPDPLHAGEPRIEMPVIRISRHERYDEADMQIRVGYELIYDCPQQTPMILALNIHYTRVSDIVVPDHPMISPSIPITAYRDGFGNWCSRIVAPKGRIRLSADAVINDSGHPDEVAPAAQQHQVQDLPEETLVFLLGSRYCETDRLSETA
jgi:hypothetical protein